MMNALTWTRRTVIPVIVAMALSGCVGNTNVQPDPAYFDLGAVPATADGIPVPVRSVDVQAASWLVGSTMQYRLAYAEGERRQAYLESRWVAPPAELLETVLRRRVASAENGLAGEGCRLRVELDEFIQVYDSSSASKALLVARLGLYTARSDALLARKAINLNRMTATADARGGVAAFSALGSEMAADVAGWLSKLALDTPIVVDRCRSGE